MRMPARAAIDRGLRTELANIQDKGGKGSLLNGRRTQASDLNI